MQQISPYLRQHPHSPAVLKPLPDSHFTDARIHLQNLWQLLRKRQWLILQILLGAVLITLAIVFSMTPIYTAKAVLLIERQAPRALDIREVVSPQETGPDEYDYYKTQFEVLKSEALAARVIAEQSLESNEYFSQHAHNGSSHTWWHATPAWLKGFVGSDTADTGDRAKLAEVRSAVDPRSVLNYQRKLAISPIQRTRLVAVTFSTPNPQLSAHIANAHAETFIRQGVEQRSLATDEARSFLEGKLIELKKRVEDSENALNLYRQQQGILSLDDRENVIVGRLVDLNKLLTEAEAERIGLEAQVQLIHKRNFTALPTVLGNTLIQTLQAQLTTLEGEYASLATQFKPGFPRLDQLSAQRGESRKRLNDEIQKVISGIESSYLAAAAKEKELRVRMEEQKGAALQLKNASVEYAILSREVDTNRQLYDSVLQRIKEIGITTDSRSSNITVVDKATPPLKPAKPKKFLSLLLGSVLGLMGGVAIAVALEYLDTTIKSPEDVQRILLLPNLAVVPDFLTLPGYTPIENGSENGIGIEDKRKRRVVRTESVPEGPAKIRHRSRPSRSRTLVTPGVTFASSSGHGHAFSPNPYSILLESYRTLRTAILLSRATEPPRTILFTSGTPGEGKSVTVVNTAIVLAQMGARVLLVDTDLRHPTCHELIGRRKKNGLTELLTGQREFYEVVQATSTPQLSFLSGGGSIPPDPAELLGSRKMHETIADLQKQFDYILIDSPPVMPVSDALLLSTFVDGVILVVDSQKTPRYVVKEMQSRFEYVQAKILGVVLNKINMKTSSYAYYYGEYVSYYPIEEKEKEPLAEEIVQANRTRPSEC